MFAFTFKGGPEMFGFRPDCISRRPHAGNQIRSRKYGSDQYTEHPIEGTFLKPNIFAGGCIWAANMILR
jgi:hypothetical protein